VSVFIGPEGGFTETEIETAVSCGICPVTWSKDIEDRDRRIAVLSILMYELGMWGMKELTFVVVDDAVFMRTLLKK